MENHIDQMMIKLNRACYAVRYVKHFMSQIHQGQFTFHIFIPSNHMA